MKKKISIILVLALLIVSTMPTSVDAAKKIRLNKTNVSMVVGKTVQLKLKNCKKKVTWKSSNKSIAFVSSKGKVKAIRAGKATITAKYKKKKYKCSVVVRERKVIDGDAGNEEIEDRETLKTAEPTTVPDLKLTEVPTVEPVLKPTEVPTVEPVLLPTIQPTAAPTINPANKCTVVEDFESYEVGTTWTHFTAGGYADPGTMTVVQDPENPDNKCLKVTYDGADLAYDYAPVFQADLTKLKDSEGNSTAGKKLGSYTGIGFDIRVVSNDPASVRYKEAYCYFDQADAITHSDYFATALNKSASAHIDNDSNPVPAGDPNEYKALRFGANISMAEGSDKEIGITLWNGNSSKEINKYFPYAYSTWIQSDATTHFAANSCTAGYKDVDGSEPKVGFASRSLIFNTARIKEADSTLLEQNKFDFVLGSIYEGGSRYKTNNISVTLYFDNISLIEEEVPITDFAVSAGDNPRLAPGGTLPLMVTYTPVETTQKELVWTTSDSKVSVDVNNHVIVEDDFDFGTDTQKTVTITATSKFNPSLTKSVNVTVYQPIEVTED